jgi:hypothetical protein
MKYFSYKEFDSPDMPGSGNLMDENFLEMLDEVRDTIEVKIIMQKLEGNPKQKDQQVQAICMD